MLTVEVKDMGRRDDKMNKLMEGMLWQLDFSSAESRKRSNETMCYDDIQKRGNDCESAAG